MRHRDLVPGAQTEADEFDSHVWSSALAPNVATLLTQCGLGAGFASPTRIVHVSLPVSHPSGTCTVLCQSAHQPYRPVSMVLLVRCRRMQPIQSQVNTHPLSTTAAEDNVTVLPAARRSSSLVVSAHRVLCCPRRASGLQPYPTAVCTVRPPCATRECSLAWLKQLGSPDSAARVCLVG